MIHLEGLLRGPTTTTCLRPGQAIPCQDWLRAVHNEPKRESKPPQDLVLPFRAVFLSPGLGSACSCHFLLSLISTVIDLRSRLRLMVNSRLHIVTLLQVPSIHAPTHIHLPTYAAECVPDVHTYDTIHHPGTLYRLVWLPLPLPLPLPLVKLLIAHTVLYSVGR